MNVPLNSELVDHISHNTRAIIAQCDAELQSIVSHHAQQIIHPQYQQQINDRLRAERQHVVHEQQRNTRLTAERDASNIRITELYPAVVQLQTLIPAATQLETRLRDLQARLNIETASLTPSIQSDTIMDTFQRLSRYIDSLENGLPNLSTEKDRQDTGVQTTKHEEEIIVLQRDLSASRLISEQQQARIAQLEQDLSTSHSTLSAAHSQQTTLQHDLSASCALAEQQQGRIVQLESAASQPIGSADYEALELSHAVLESQHAEAEEDGKQTQARITQLELELTTSQSTLSTLNIQHEALKTTHSSLESQYADTQRDEQAKIIQLEIELTTSQSNLSTVRSEHEALESTHAGLISQHADLEEDIGELRSLAIIACNDPHTSIREALGKLLAMNEERGAVMQQMDDLQAARTGASDEAERIKLLSVQEREMLKAEVETLQTRLGEAEAKSQQQAAELASSQSLHLTTIVDQNDAASQEQATLKKSVDALKVTLEETQENLEEALQARDKEFERAEQTRREREEAKAEWVHELNTTKGQLEVALQEEKNALEIMRQGRELAVRERVELQSLRQATLNKEEAVSHEAAALRTSLDELTAALAQTKDSLKEALRERDEAIQTASSEFERAEQLRGEVRRDWDQTLKTVRETLEAQWREKLREAVDHLATVLTENEANIAEAREEEKELARKEREELQEKLQEMTARWNGADWQLQTNVKNLAAAEDEVVRLGEVMTRERDQLNQDLSRTRDELSAALTKNQATEGQVLPAESLERQDRERLVQELNVVRGQLAAAQNDAREAAEEEWKNALRASQDESLRLRESLRSLEQEVHGCEFDSEMRGVELDAEAERMKREAEGLKSQLLGVREESASTVSGLQNEVARLQARFDIAEQNVAIQRGNAQKAEAGMKDLQFYFDSKMDKIIGEFQMLKGQLKVMTDRWMALPVREQEAVRQRLKARGELPANQASPNSKRGPTRNQ